MDQKIQFCKARDGVSISYATAGKGQPLVKAPNWVTHLEFEWHNPVYREWWQELAEHRLLIRFDQRGSGLSDWDVDDLSFDAWVSDLESVVEHLGIDHFAVLGISQGGAVAIEYAARHPEKVSHLVLHGAYARGWIKRGQPLKEFEAMLTVIREGWGLDKPAWRQIFSSQFLPGAATETSWFNEIQRLSTSPENAVRFQREAANIDVLDRLPLVTSPTLVLHNRGDNRVPFEQGRQISALIPDARFVPVESNNHLPLETEPAWNAVLSEVLHFLGVKGDKRSSALPLAPSSVSHAKTLARIYPGGLTEREVEVIRLVYKGKSNREIADELFISLSTVSSHVTNILSKTDTANRTEAAMYASQHGLV